jgi:hypothetical protein
VPLAAAPWVLLESFICAFQICANLFDSLSQRRSRAPVVPAAKTRSNTVRTGACGVSHATSRRGRVTNHDMSIAVVLPGRIDLAGTKKKRLSFHFECRPREHCDCLVFEQGRIGRTFQARDRWRALVRGRCPRLVWRRPLAWSSKKATPSCVRRRLKQTGLHVAAAQS